MADRRKLTLGVAAILVASMLAGAGSFAYFSDVETSSGNTFMAGTLDVKIRDGADTYQDDLDSVWKLIDLKPGDNDGPGQRFNFKNYGSIKIDHMDITCSYKVTESDEEPDKHDTAADPDKMAAEFTITSLWVSKGDGNSKNLLLLLYPDQDINNNGRPDLEDLKKAGINGITIVPDPNQGSHTFVDIELEFDQDAGNDFQGDTLILTMIFTFNQHSDQ